MGGGVDYVVSYLFSVMRKMKKKKGWKRLIILVNRGKFLDSYFIVILVWVIVSVFDVRVFN